MGMSQVYGIPDENESIATIHAALDAGIDFLDTADIYGVGHNEELVGRAIKDRRDGVILATKFGNVRGADGSPEVNGHPDYVKQACDASLSRLGVDYIDLYYQHRVDPNVPVEDTFGALHELVEQGKIRYLGISEASAATVRRAHGVHPLCASQSEYSLFTREIEDELLPTLRELGIGLVAYSPLGRGFLSGTITRPDQFGEGDNRGAHPRFSTEHFDHNLAVVERLTALAASKHVTPSQLALAWVLARGNDVVPIPGTKRRTYLMENIASVSISLSAEEIAVIDEQIPQGSFTGDRYPAVQMARVNL
jgi:aryl-alcohol dehydrogenase-like predicted oxidoreductase